MLALRELEGGAPEVRAEFISALQRSVEGARTPASCTLLRDRLNVLVKHTPRRDRAAFANALIAVISGRDTYAPNPARPAVLALDPCAAVIYKLAGRKTPAQLKAEEARLAAEEAKRLAAQPLTTAEKARQDLPRQK